MVISWQMNGSSGYSVVIDGVTIQCQTAGEAIRLAKEAAAAGVATQATPAGSTSSATRQDAPPPPVDVADESRSKWTEPAKRVIVLLTEAGSEGVDADRVAEVGGLKSSKGSAPLLKAIIELLGVDPGAVDRPRDASDGRKRWVLKPRGVRAAAKLGLIQQG